MEKQPFAPIESATTLAAVGDVHGDVPALFRLLDVLADSGIRCVIGLGDVGILWGRNSNRDVQKVEARLSANEQTFYWVDGNHENHTLIATYPTDRRGRRPISTNFIHLPRGHRVTLASGRALAALGGANSVDRSQRSTWWPAESVSGTDLATLGPGYADLIISHDAPEDVLALDNYLDKTAFMWPQIGIAYSQAGRAMFHRGFLQVRPKLSVGGHYHLPIDEAVGYAVGDHGFATRVVVLDTLQHVGTASVAMIDTGSLAIRFLTADGEELPVREPLTELTESMTGEWVVHTRDSRHRFDLDAGTVDRILGPDAQPEPSDRVRRLRSIDRCRLGERGRWAVEDLEPNADQLWHESSIIRHIVPVKSGGR
ncbi:metallophosphoesterase family protein [Microbacterium panaciterrae]|uniref:Calcineurin-like phosphoesterase domain-containing protein n=1 Tax=Microbacterium panaciterrae TaxID=985759 RepID=A0ABP8P6D4_9MICO